MNLAEDNESEMTTIDWLRFNCRLTQNVASDRVAIGEKLAAMPLSEDALYNGEIGIQHLATMAKTARAVGKEFDEKRLLPLAKKHSPGKFYHESLHYRHSVRPQEVASEQADLAENRALSMSTAEDGCLILQGVLDPVGGAALRTALEWPSRWESLITANGRSGWRMRSSSSRRPAARSPSRCRSPVRSKRCLAFSVRRAPRPSSPFLSPPRRWSGGPATAASPGSSCKTRCRSTSAAPSRRSGVRGAAPWSLGISTAGGRVANGPPPGVTATISSAG